VVSWKEAAEIKESVSSEALIEMLDQLQSLLEDSDAAAADLMPQIEAQCGDDDCRQQAQAISTHIDDFEFDLALELLHGLRPER